MSIFFKNFDFHGPMFRVRGLIFGRKNTSICYLLNVILVFFTSRKMLTIKTPEYVKLAITLKIKAPLM